MSRFQNLTGPMQALFVVALFAADRLTKWLACDELRPRGSVPVLPFFSLTYVENTGAAFGLGQRRNGVLIVVASGLLAWVLYMRRKWPRGNPWLQYGALLVVAGALGNLYDRIVLGYVVDFLDFKVWPVFNLADSCVCVGAACLAWGFRRA